MVASVNDDVGFFNEGLIWWLWFRRELANQRLTANYVGFRIMTFFMYN